MNVGDIWVTAWNKYSALAKDLKRSRANPEAIINRELAEHSVTSTLHPYVRILIEEKEVMRIVLDVSLIMKLKGFVLEIQNGRIVAAKSGSFEGSGEIRIKGASLIQRDFKPVQLPGRVEFFGPRVASIL